MRHGLGRLGGFGGVAGGVYTPPPAPEVPGALAASSQSAKTNIVGTVTSNLPLAPLTFAPGWSVFLVGDVGLTGGGASPMTWADQSGNGRDATQSSAGFIPSATASLLNGRAGVVFDGTNDFLTFAGLDLPAPGTTPSWIFSVWRLRAWTSGKNIYAGGTTSCMRLLCITATPQMQKHNGTLSASLSPTINTWQCSEDYYSNSAADYMRIGASSTTPANSGNTDPASGAFRLGSSNNAGANAPAMDMVAFGIRASLPSGTVISDLRAWVTSMWGGSVAV